MRTAPVTADAPNATEIEALHSSALSTDKCKQLPRLAFSLLITKYMTFKFCSVEKEVGFPKSNYSRMETLTWKLFQDFRICHRGFLKDDLAGTFLLLWTF